MLPYYNNGTATLGIMAAFVVQQWGKPLLHSEWGHPLLHKATLGTIPLLHSHCCFKNGRIYHCWYISTYVAVQHWDDLPDNWTNPSCNNGRVTWATPVKKHPIVAFQQWVFSSHVYPVGTVSEAPAESTSTFAGRKPAALHWIAALLDQMIVVNGGQTQQLEWKVGRLFQNLNQRRQWWWC